MLSLLIKLFVRFTARLFLRPPAGIAAGTPPPTLLRLRDWPDQMPTRMPFPIARRAAPPKLSHDDVPPFSL